MLATVAVSCLWAFVVVNAQYLSCPLLGPDFPAPTNLRDDTSIIAAAQNLTRQIEGLLAASSNLLDTATSFSVQLFAAESGQPLFDYHYTGPSVAGSTDGAQNITEHSIYRVGSIGKLYTIYSFLSEAGEDYFSRPITDFVPELAQSARDTAQDNDINATRWEDITIGALASQQAGIGRDDGQVDLLSAHVPWTELGFPGLTSSELPSCGYNSSFPACTRALFLQGLVKHQPVFLPYTTPLYSNNAFGVLSFALESITRKSFSSIMTDMFARLKLTETSYTFAPARLGVIPWNISYSGWEYDEASNDPAGSIYASTVDLSKFGRAILNHALISPAATRRWMKPQTFTSSMSLAVGAPWEIYRVEGSNRVTDHYTKGGDIGVWSSLLSLIPDYNVGFSVFTADGSASDVAAQLSNMVAQTFGPALEQSAKLQANATYSGVYIANNGVNSSIAIEIDDNFGLRIQSWVSEGHDMFANIALTQGVTSTDAKILVNLQPTNLISDGTTGTRRAFRAIFGFEGRPPTNVFNLNCATWTTVDALSYGGVSIDLFVFETDAAGNVESLTLPALHSTFTAQTKAT